MQISPTARLCKKVYPERRGSTTLGLIATSVHPAQAGVQIDLLRTLLDAGALVNGLPGGWNPLIVALHNGRGAERDWTLKEPRVWADLM